MDKNNISTILCWASDNDVHFLKINNYYVYVSLKGDYAMDMKTAVSIGSSMSYSTATMMIDAVGIAQNIKRVLTLSEEFI